MVNMATHEDSNEPEVDENGYRGPSKSARKREADTLQELGVQLADLPDDEVRALDLPEALYTAIRELHRLPTHGAKFRQRQYIGKLMRKIDPEPVLAKLATRKQQHDADIRSFQVVERWRDRLLGEPDALNELIADHPQADRVALRQLLKTAAQERTDQRSPAAARKLFAYLKKLLE
jgi:ribosome-associated protein